MKWYESFINYCKSLIGKISTEWLIYGAVCAIAFFMLWTILAVISSKYRRFYLKCSKLTDYLYSHHVGLENMWQIDKHAQKISRSFFYGWNKFKNSKVSKPSDILTKHDILDADMDLGNINHGKNLMKSFIGFTTVLLFVINVTFIGKDLPFSFGILVEAMFLPIVYCFILVMLYLIYNILRHQIYLIAGSHFYELIDKLDDCFSRDYFGENQKVIETESKEVEIQADDANLENQPEPEAESANEVETQVEETESSDEEAEQKVENREELENEETEETKTQTAMVDLDEYDIFKKKNIDVDKYINEIPDESYNTPFIDVNRSYVPSDELADESVQVEEVADLHPLDEGVAPETNIQETSEKIYDFDDDSLNVETSGEENSEQSDINLDENSQNNNEELIEESEVENSENETEEENNDQTDLEEPQSLESEDAESFNLDSIFDSANEGDNSENESESLNEDNIEESEQDIDLKEQLSLNAEDSLNEANEKLETEENQNVDLSELVDEYKMMQDLDTEESNDAETENSNNVPAVETDENVEKLLKENNENSNVVDAQAIFNSINDIKEILVNTMNGGSNEEKPKKSRVLKKGKKKMTENEKKTRGRPKKQVIDENLVITNDEQFEEILSRAEKLMRKNDEGLSQSQSKRIEKELKIMVDAMNKYKEGAN